MDSKELGNFHENEEMGDFWGPKLKARREMRSKGVKSMKANVEGEIEKYEDQCNFLDGDAHIFTLRERERERKGLLCMYQPCRAYPWTKE